MDIGEKIKLLRLEKKLTQEELAVAAGTKKQTIHKYEIGIITNIPASKIKAIADKLGTTPAYLMGWEHSEQAEDDIKPIKLKKFPMLGEIACGNPIMCEQNYETFIEASENLQADFCLTAKGDSMINARIKNGDIVFIRQQPIVENGEIAAVIIDDTATLKRVYIQNNYMTLMAENPEYAPIVIQLSEDINVRILGKAVAFQSLIV